MSQATKLERIAEARAKLAIADRLMGEVVLELEKMSMDGQAFCVSQDLQQIVRRFAEQGSRNIGAAAVDLGCALACLRREVQQGKNLRA